MIAPPKLLTDPPVLAEKLRRPYPSPLARPRLERRLLDALTGDPGGVLATVVAPAGSGKTSLVAAVAAAAPVPVAWCRLTDDERSEAGLVALLSRAVLDARSGRTGVIPEPGHSGAVRGIRALLADLDALTEPLLLVIDDCAAVAGTPAEKALARLVDLRSPRCSIVLAGRRPIDVNVPRLRLNGSVVEIGGADLALRPSEVGELFATVFREPLPPSAVATLTRQTGGWAAGLTLFQLATSGLPPGHRADAAGQPATQCRLIRRYLESEILQSLSADDRRFLLLTSFLDSLTGPRADALLSASGSATRLAGFERDEIFVQSTDDAGSFAYHPVLRSYLQTLFHEELSEREAERWLARTKALGDAGPSGVTRRSLPVRTPLSDELQVRCFGRFEIRDAGTPLSLDPLRPRARSVLRLLSLHANESLHREQLVEWWWPEAEPAVGMHRLQVAISSVRHWLEENAPAIRLTRREDSYLLSAPERSVDVCTFEKLILAADLASRRGELDNVVEARSRALRIYRGDLLADEGPADNVVAERERLRLLAAANAFALARHFEHIGRRDEAVAAVRRAIDLEPYSDRQWQLLADLHDRSGDSTAAARTRRDHRLQVAQLA